jgi:hypothetical protein
MTTEDQRLGRTIERPIVIAASDSAHGVEMEYAHLRQLFGTNWTLERQTLLRIDARSYDVMELAVQSRQETVFFDISSFMRPKRLKAGSGKRRGTTDS